jgi:hypothetical protein
MPSRRLRSKPVEEEEHDVEKGENQGRGGVATKGRLAVEEGRAPLVRTRKFAPQTGQERVRARRVGPNRRRGRTAAPNLPMPAAAAAAAPTAAPAAPMARHDKSRIWQVEPDPVSIRRPGPPATRGAALRWRVIPDACWKTTDKGNRIPQQERDPPTTRTEGPTGKAGGRRRRHGTAVHLGQLRGERRIETTYDEHILIVCCKS